jgi:hypothetical protein
LTKSVGEKKTLKPTISNVRMYALIHFPPNFLGIFGKAFVLVPTQLIQWCTQRVGFGAAGGRGGGGKRGIKKIIKFSEELPL